MLSSKPRCTNGVFHLLIAGAFILSATAPTSANDRSNTLQFHSKKSAVVAYSDDNPHVIEGTVIGDFLKIKMKDGTAKEMDTTAMNSAAKDKLQHSWNLYLFYISRDAWRMLRHQNQDEQHVEKSIGQANITLLVNADGSSRILNKQVYIAGEPPYTGNKMSPKAERMWQQAKAALSYIEFKSMKIPDPNATSITLEMIIGRDYEKFPRYPAGQMKVDGLVRNSQNGKITHIGKS